MAKSSVKLDYKDLEKLKKQLEQKCNEAEVDRFMKSCAKELAARLIAKAVKRTPVGDYPKGSGKVGGTLRRGWTGNAQTDAAQYANSLRVEHVGGDYVITITNPVEYASYVEYGHRTVNHSGWVEGEFMLTVSENEIRQLAPQILEKKLTAYLKGLMK